jgi:hypothetical protein
MPLQSFSNSLVATSSGMIGGVAKAVSSGFTLCTISVPHIIEVSVYAGISAFVGYLVKLGVDTLRKKVFPNNKKSKG